ncbi:exonuclease SbcD [Dyadobacter jejuensis]|uniref:Nuclease SbcCD subunit D n=1 Tax=Dyadobacter jejuensis TaxID=1082580 RepID=A0A316AR88_9BACT|nr:exonuclease subunit SbcD [Dyadobacter jejuensis]PWJ60122.1 exonuclease SbcD [Dyadobacter jejuensis]
MKILHTADWHIGKKLDTYSRLTEQRLVLNEICEIAEKQSVDAVVVAGDLFDNFAPSSEATELLYTTLHRLADNGRRAVIAIAGNHDSPERIEVPDALARVCGIIFIGFPNATVTPFRTQAGIAITKSEPGFIELSLPRCDIPLRVIHTPYANEQRLKVFLGTEQQETALRDHLQQHWQALALEHLDDRGFNLLVTHLYVMKEGGEEPEEPDDERPILHIGGAQAIYTHNFPTGLQYVALGHLHRYQVVDTHPAPIVYASSPLAYSFSEADQQKYVVLLHAAAGQLESFQRIELQAGKRLKRVKFKGVDTALAWLMDHQHELIELTLESDTYLEASDKKRLTDCHEGIIQIIPQIKNMNEGDSNSEIDLSLSIDQLFEAYFKSKNKGQQPSEGLMEVFKEVLGTQEE